MRVYILSTGSHEDWTILGIYSSLAWAEEEKAKYEKPQPVDWKDEPHSYKANEIQGFEVDQRIPDLYGNVAWK